MNPYACYPARRPGFRSPVTRFAYPHYSPATSETLKTSAVAHRPLANIIREDHGYKIQLAVPGLTREQIKIELKDHHLIITGPEATAETPKGAIRKEFDYTGFRREFRLHKNADAENLSATMEQGILTIVVPDAKPETISISIQ